MPLELFVPSEINLKNAAFYFFHWSCNVMKVEMKGFLSNLGRIGYVVHS